MFISYQKHWVTCKEVIHAINGHHSPPLYIQISVTIYNISDGKGKISGWIFIDIHLTAVRHNWKLTQVQVRKMENAVWFFFIYYRCDEINFVCLWKLLGIRYSYCCNVSSSKDEQAERNTSEMLRCCFKAQLYLLQEKIIKVI